MKIANGIHQLDLKRKDQELAKSNKRFKPNPVAEEQQANKSPEDVVHNPEEDKGP